MRTLPNHMSSKQAFATLSVDDPPRQPHVLSKRGHSPSPEPSPGLRLTFHLLIVNNSKDSVLASVISDTQLRLPIVRPLIRQLYYMNVSVRRMYKLHHWEVESCSLEHFIHAQLHIRFHTLQTLCYYPSASTRPAQEPQEPQVMVLGVVEAPDPCSSALPSHPRVRWVSRNQLSDFHWGRVLDGVDVQSQIDAVLQRINHNPRVTHSAPWFWLGWVDAMQSWVRGELSAQQLAPVSSLRLVCNTGEGCVLRCRVSRLNQSDKQRKHSSNFDVFIKAVRSPSREPYRVAVISSLLPSYVPQVLAVHRKHNVMIQKSAGAPLDASANLSALIKTLWQLHMSSSRHITTLKTSGLHVLDSYWLSAKFDSIMHHPAIVSMEYYPDVKRDIMYIRSKSALVRELCDEISKVPIPLSLIHGDLNVHNIASMKCDSGVRYGFFDWGSSFIGHPFYDLRTLLHDEGARSLVDLTDDSIGRNFESHVVQYLSVWKSYGTLSELMNVYDLMDILRHGIEIHRLTQLYDTYMGIERRTLIPRIHSEIRGLRIMTEEFATCTGISNT
ncbi:Aminoglycoside phosphotransferase [Gracilaria domingensis]|nr:Aminoglycoside phosphotransferase [Gracilaria domingensis]